MSTRLEGSSSERMARAVEKVREYLLRVSRSLEGDLWAVCGSFRPPISKRVVVWGRAMSDRSPTLEPREPVHSIQQEG